MLLVAGAGFISGYIEYLMVRVAVRVLERDP